MTQSPLNYTGGKFKLLPQILPLFPQNINTFVDLFCGGGNVGTNVNCQQVHFNDINQNVIGILNAFATLDKEETLQIINDTIAQYNLSNVSTNGYAYYNCISSKGLGNYNRQSFYALRQYFNQQNRRDYQYYILLFVLTTLRLNPIIPPPQRVSRVFGM